MNLRHDVGIVRAEWLGPVWELLREIEHTSITTSVRLDERLQRLAAEPGRRHLVGDVHPRARLDRADVVVRAIERAARCSRRGSPAEGPHDLIADLLGKAPEARELGARDGKEATVGSLGNDLVFT